MGQPLSEPVTEKETSSDENNFLKVGASSMQGWRNNMEDSYVQKLCFNDDKDSHYFAVYDGHGGVGTSRFAMKQLHLMLAKQPEYRKGEISCAMKNTFMKFDETLKSQSLTYNDLSGSTAVSVLVKNEKIYCANIGDSRAVASVRGHAQLLSFDHKPHHERERARIELAGGFVEGNRVNGNLALSRAFGDFMFKQNAEMSPEEQIVTASPDVLVKDITSEHEFVVLASDGIWDVMNNQDVVEFVREKLAARNQPDAICEQLMEACLASENHNMTGVGLDNMTAVLIVFKRNSSFDQVCDSCAQPKSNPIPPTCLLSSYPPFVRGGISCL